MHYSFALCHFNRWHVGLFVFVLTSWSFILQLKIAVKLLVAGLIQVSQFQPSWSCFDLYILCHLAITLNDVSKKTSCQFQITEFFYVTSSCHELKYLRTEKCLSQNYMLLQYDIMRIGAVFYITYTLSQKKRHWCCRLYLQRTSTDFNSFWQVISRVFELSYVHLIFHVRLLLLPYFAASLRRRKWRILTSLVVCKHAVY